MNLWRCCSNWLVLNCLGNEIIISRGKQVKSFIMKRIAYQFNFFYVNYVIRPNLVLPKNVLYNW